jgi:hypothetical protein
MMKNYSSLLTLQILSALSCIIAKNQTTQNQICFQKYNVTTSNIVT